MFIQICDKLKETSRLSCIGVLTIPETKMNSRELRKSLVPVFEPSCKFCGKGEIIKKWLNKGQSINPNHWPFFYMNQVSSSINSL